MPGSNPDDANSTTISRSMYTGMAHNQLRRNLYRRGDLAKSMRASMQANGIRAGAGAGAGAGSGAAAGEQGHHGGKGHGHGHKKTAATTAAATKPRKAWYKVCVSVCVSWCGEARYVLILVTPLCVCVLGAGSRYDEILLQYVFVFVVAVVLAT